MTEELKPKPDLSKSEKVKSAAKRAAQKQLAQERLAQGGKGESVNPLVNDETYGGLREENRVVMRHTIALNIENFRAAADDFQARPTRTYPALQSTCAPFASVIIPNYNGQRFLPTLLAALNQQTFGDLEIILADDASTDDSVVWVEQHYPDVRVLVNRHNVGFVRTCNAAVDAARGRVVVLLNNDTEPEAQWLAELVKALCENPQAAIAASKMLLFDQRDQLHTTGDLLGRDGLPRNRGVWEIDRGQYDNAQQIFSGSGGGSAFRKDAWQQLGGFDDDFWMYLEDVDFGFRAQLAGWQAIFVPNARLYHHLCATAGGALASYYVGRNTIWTLAKNMPLGLLRRNLPSMVAGQLGITLNALRAWRGEAARARLRGQLAGILGLPRQLRKRQLIQSRRLVEDGDLLQRLS